MPLKSTCLTLFHHSKRFSEFSTSKLDLDSFKFNLARLMQELNLITDIPDILSTLFNSLESQALPYDLTYTYEPKCKTRIVGSEPTEVFQDLSQEGSKNDFVVIFDLDETLIHVSKDGREGYVMFVRPMVQTLIDLLARSGLKLAVWTAAMESHALQALDIIDPEGKIKFVLHRPSSQHAGAINWSSSHLHEYNNCKALDLLPGDLQKRALLFDNSTASLYHASSRSRSVLVPNYEPKLGVNEAEYKNDRFWLAGLYFIMRAYSSFRACDVHLRDIGQYLSEFTQQGLLTESSIRGQSFLALNSCYFPSISDFSLQNILKSIGVINPDDTKADDVKEEIMVSSTTFSCSASVSASTGVSTMVIEKNISSVRLQMHVT